MRHRNWTTAVVGALALSGGMLTFTASGPAPAGAEDAPAISGNALEALRGDFIALRSRGPAQNVSSDPTRTVFEFNLQSMATGEQVGTATDDVFCSTKKPPPCAVFDAVTTFHLPDGEITSHAQVSVVPDPQHPGGFLVGIQPGDAEIVGASGIYAGRKGRITLSGWNDGSRYPDELNPDDRWLIELDPR